MRKLMLRLWNDDCGALIATEWVFLATILVLGSITGLVAVRQAVITQFAELANAVMALDQRYSFSGQGDDCTSLSDEENGGGLFGLDLTDQTSQQVHTAGSAAIDHPDHIGIRSNAAWGTTIDQRPCD
jgi:Flp pilus assembly pilin Flp